MDGQQLTIRLNGRPHEVPPGLTLEELLRQIGAGGPGLAVAVNDSVVRRGEHAGVIIRDGDRIEVIQAVGGG